MPAAPLRSALTVAGLALLSMLAAPAARAQMVDPVVGILGHTAKIEISIVEKDGGAPVRGGHVRLIFIDTKGQREVARINAPDGKAQFDSVPPGDYRVRVLVDGYEPVMSSRIRVRRAAVSTVEVKIDTRKGATKDPGAAAGTPASLASSPTRTATRSTRTR